MVWKHDAENHVLDCFGFPLIKAGNMLDIVRAENLTAIHINAIQELIAAVVGCNGATSIIYHQVSLLQYETGVIFHILLYGACIRKVFCTRLTFFHYLYILFPSGHAPAGSCVLAFSSRMGGGLMANLLDYLSWRADVPFSCAPFNDVDNLILSEFAYLSLEHALPEGGEMTVAELSKALHGIPDAFGYIEQDSNRAMLALMGEGGRFASAKVCSYRHDTNVAQEKQFAAMTFLLPDNTAFIAYRGTDDTLVGWKEDFNLSFACPVPAQADALVYLLEASRRFDLPIRVGGHSKGGNLSVYASAYAPEEVQDRIISVFSNDGPGMDEGTFASCGYTRIMPKLRSIVPDSSIIGMLLQHHEDYMVVKSTASGLMQHNPFSWQVKRAGFEVIDALRPGSRNLDQVLRSWLSGMTAAERMTLVDTLFDALAATHITTVENIGEAVLHNAGAMLSSLRHMDVPTRRRVRQLVVGLLSAKVMGRV